MNEEKWTQMDGAIDDVLTKVRAGQPNPAVIKASLQSFISVMENLGKQAATPRTQASPTVAKSSNQPLGDLSAYRKIAEDMRRMVDAGDFSGAKTRAGDLESEWDNAQTKLRPINPEKWTMLDNAIDDVLKKVRSAQPNRAASSASLESLIAVINNMAKQNQVNSTKKRFDAEVYRRALQHHRSQSAQLAQEARTEACQKPFCTQFL
jgi:flagellar biosynthesis chaperone FliJ